MSYAELMMKDSHHTMTGHIKTVYHKFEGLPWTRHDVALRRLLFFVCGAKVEREFAVNTSLAAGTCANKLTEGIQWSIFLLRKLASLQVTSK